jgi:hypothetical protein
MPAAPAKSTTNDGEKAHNVPPLVFAATSPFLTGL